MIIYASESTIMGLAEKTNRLSVLSLDATKNYKSLSGVMDTAPAHAKIAPAPDTIQAISNGDVSVKKTIKKVVKAFKNPEKIKNSSLPVDLYLLACVIADNVEKGRITAVIAPDVGGDERLASFFKKYFMSLMKLFGFKVATPDDNKKDRKVLKAVLKGKKKKLKSKIKEYAQEGAMNDEGAELMSAIRKAYSLEILSDSFESSMRNGVFVIKRLNVKRAAKALTKALTGKDKRAKGRRKFYNELRDMEMFKMPSAKKIMKGAKKGKDVKFKKAYLPIIIRHLALRTSGVNLGSKSYFSDMMPIVKGVVNNAENEKNFRDTIKSYVDSSSTASSKPASK